MPSTKFRYLKVDIQGGRYRWAYGTGDIPWEKFVDSPYPTAYEFSVALDYRIVTGSTDETVIAINFGKGGSDEYQLIAAKNVFYLSRLINGVSENLTSVAFTRRRGEWQRLGVVVANQVIRGYVDSTMLLERRDASFSGGTIGLSIGSFAPRDDVVVEIDNVEFRRPGDAVR